MFPNSANTSFSLLSIHSIVDSLGIKKQIVKNSKEVIGCMKSITSAEFQNSVALNKKFDVKIVLQAFLYDESKYVLLKNEIYKIERTFINGQFIELYLSLTELTKEELYGSNA